MLYLVLSILCSAAMSILMRISEDKVTSRLGMFFANYITCLVFAWHQIGFGSIFPQVNGFSAMLGMGVFNGVFFLISLIMSQYNIAVNGVVLASVFSRMGSLLIPLLMSILIFREIPTVFQYIGFLLAVTAIFMLNDRKGEESRNGGSKLALFGLLLADGCAGIMSKVFAEVGNSALSEHFFFYTFGTAMIFCMIMIIVKGEKIGKTEIIYGVVIGIPNFIGSRLVLKALETVPAVIVYPSRSVATIVLITAVGMVMFQERLSRQQLAAMGIILVSLVLLNL